MKIGVYIIQNSEGRGIAVYRGSEYGWCWGHSGEDVKNQSSITVIREL